MSITVLRLHYGGQSGKRLDPVWHDLKSRIIDFIHLSNTTGRRAGTFVRFDFGIDLFGLIHLERSYGKGGYVLRHTEETFRSKVDFLIALDQMLGNAENRNYVIVSSRAATEGVPSNLP